jgi:Ca2+-binding RTX toxin-like protein
LADVFEITKCEWCNVSGGDGEDSFILAGTSYNCTLYGGAAKDTFNGGGFIDGWVYGDDGGFNTNPGGDILTGTGVWSNTTIYGEEGDDKIDCQDAIGNIFMFGNAGNDRLFGGTGNDEFNGGTGSDWMSGGPGDDTFRSVDGLKNDIIYGGDHVLGDKAYVDPAGEWIISEVENVQ